MRQTLILATLAVLAAPGCGGEEIENSAETCSTDTASDAWEISGEPFVLNWCRGCHTRDLPTGQRGNAPLSINLDSLEDVLEHKSAILTQVNAGTMPPATELSDSETTEFLSWLECAQAP